jgi:competence protein ComEA
MECIQTYFNQILAKYKHETILISVSLIIAIVALLLFASNQSSSSTAPEVKISDESSLHTEKVKYLYADISGAVNEPGVYQLDPGERMIDVLKKANGLSEEADKDYFRRNFNLAREIKDGEKIYIPSQDETTKNRETNMSTSISMTGNAQEVLGQSSKMIDINTASLEELDRLPGIGKATAEKIISGRPYTSIEELLNKKIVKKNIFEGIKAQVSGN